MKTIISKDKKTGKKEKKQADDFAAILLSCGESVYQNKHWQKVKSKAGVK